MEKMNELIRETEASMASTRRDIENQKGLFDVSRFNIRLNELRMRLEALREAKALWQEEVERMKSRSPEAWTSIRKTLNEVVNDLKVRHVLTDEAAADIKREMAQYAFYATVDSAVRDEAVNEMMQEHRKKSGEFHRKYEQEHALCPKCGHDKCSSTYAGYILDMSKPEAYRDENDTVCGRCKHSCERHERISAEEWELRKERSVP